MKLVTAEDYIYWFTEIMTNRVEPKFHIEQWGKETIEKLYQSGMIGFLQKFNGHSEQITKEFINNFSQDKTQIGELSIPVTQEFLSKALNLPMIGENYHKGLHFKEKAWTFFLEKNRKGTFDRAKGIPREWFNEPWGELVMIIQKFLTCDRQYSIAHLYHVRLLQHIKGDGRINLPYFLYKSLVKMVETVKQENKPKATQVYHQGLIKILVEYQVKEKGLDWKEFMHKHHFTEHFVDIQDKVEQEDRSMMNSPFYPRTRAKKLAMHEIDTSISVPRTRNSVDFEKEVEAYSPRKPEEQEPLERDSIFDNDAGESLMKTTQDFEKELNLAKIQDLTDQLEISKIVEKQLKSENKAQRKENAKLIKTNDKLQEEISRLKRRNELLSKQAFKWLKDKNTWQAKYEKQKVKAAILKAKQESELDYVNRETDTGTTSTSGGRRSKRSKQAWGHA